MRISGKYTLTLTLTLTLTRIEPYEDWNELFGRYEAIFLSVKIANLLFNILKPRNFICGPGVAWVRVRGFELSIEDSG